MASLDEEIDEEFGCRPDGVHVRRLADIEPEAIRWLWPGRLPLGKLCMIVGDPGLGKSMATLAIAATVTNGSTWPIRGEGSAPAGEVILISCEDDPADTIRPRLDAAAADCQRVHILDGLDDKDDAGRTFRRPWAMADIDALDSLIASLPDCRLIVIDPLSAYLGGTDTHRNSDVRAMLAPLSELAARHGVTVLCVSHLNKGAGQAMYRTTGSLAFTAAARAVYAVCKDAADPGRRLILPVKANLAPNKTGCAYHIGTTAKGIPRIEWEVEPVEADIDEVLSAGSGAGRPDNERREAKDWLREALSEGPVAVRDLQDDAEAAGHAWATIRRAKDDLDVFSGRAGTGWTWRLREGAQKSRCSEPQDTNSEHVETQESQGVNGQGGQGAQNSGPQGNCEHVEGLSDWYDDPDERAAIQAEARGDYD